MHMRLHCNGKVIKNATWSDIEAVLPELRGEAFFVLSIRPVPESGPRALEVQSENGNYLPFLGLADVRGGRAFVNPDGRGKDDVSVGGYEYTAMAVTQDFDLIVRMIKEFYETGDVSKDLLK